MMTHFTRSMLEQKINLNSNGCRSWRLSRRLRAEAMEGRLMLSTNGSPADAEDPIAVNVSTEFQFLPGVGVNSYLTSAYNGGFINFSANGNTLQSSPSVVKVWGHADDTSVNYFSGSFDSWQLNSDSVSGIDSDGDFSAPRVFPISSLGPAVTDFQSQSDSPTAAAQERNEGGLIAVEDFLPSYGVKNPTTSLAATTASSSPTIGPYTPVNESLTASLAKSASDEISGEWARAAVFEIAGGEPTAASSPIRNAFRSRLSSMQAELQGAENAQTATHAHDSGQNAHLVSYESSSSAQSHAKSPASQDNQATSAISVTLAATLNVYSPGAAFLNANSVAERFFRAEQNADAALNAPQSDPKAEEAAAAVFDRIGLGEKFDNSSSTDDGTLRSSLTLAPVLMFLAFERIAPRARRRQMANAKPAATPLPRR